MPHWLHSRSARAGTHDWFECDAAGVVLRQASFAGPLPTGSPATVAASRSELAECGDHFGPFGLRLYAQVYGTLTEVPVPVPDGPGSANRSAADSVVRPVTQAEFGRAWTCARVFRQCEVPNTGGLLPDGTVLHGTVARTPWPRGVTGLFVDVGLSVPGFLDVLTLPRDAERWPAEGERVVCEVVGVRAAPPQIRLRLRPAAAPRSAPSSPRPAPR